MITFIDNFLNQITMYRLILYYLIFLLFAAVLLSVVGLLHFNAFAIIISSLLFVAVCWITNKIFAKVFEVPTNFESVYISALILALIINPVKGAQDLPFILWAGVWAMAAKYIVAINRKHIFNPVAFAVALLALTNIGAASWWVGTPVMLPFVLLGGILMVRKIQRYDMVFYFIVTAFAASLILGFFKGSDVMTIGKEALLHSPLLFFSFVMLTEPLTTPPIKKLQIFYGILVGFLFAPQVHIGKLYSTPELALIAGNIFSYFVSPKERLLLRLKEKIEIAPNLYEFVFHTNKHFLFRPGQYMEWTLSHTRPDSRGTRRYFTISSSPTERDIRLGIRFYSESSSYKRALLHLDKNSQVVASQLAGDFVLSSDAHKKSVFIAGGIGITPFRSMIQYLLDKDEKRPIIVLYANKTSEEVVYKDIFDTAHKKLGIKTVYVFSSQQTKVHWPNSRMGRINVQMLRDEVPDFKDRMFYISGQRSMVTDFEKVLREMEVKNDHIITDFFPGFA